MNLREYFADSFFLYIFKRKYKLNQYSVESEKTINAREKQRDFLMCIEKLRSFDKVRFSTLESLCMYVATQVKADRFYVSGRHALSIYHRYKREGNLNWLSARMRCMYYDLFIVYENTFINEYLNKKNINYSEEELMERAIQCEAKSFYLEPKSALNYYYRAMRNKRKKSK